jgi:hypothetical protein
LSWARENRELLDRIRAYILEFKDSRPAFFENFQGGSDPIFPLEVHSERGVGMLLYFCALYQGIGEGRLSRVLAYLWKQYDKDLFRLGRLPFLDLQDRMKALTDLHDWPLWSKSPGILRSVADFFYRHGGLLAWVHAQGDAEKCITTLSEEIFLMGKTSLFRSKARYFLWMVTRIDGARPERFWTPETRLPLTLGHGRFIREFGPLKGRKAVPWTRPEEKLDFFHRFHRLLNPDAPWLVFPALDAFMRPQAGPRKETEKAAPEWLCRKVLGGCVRCPLAPECPGRDF